MKSVPIPERVAFVHFFALSFSSQVFWLHLTAASYHENVEDLCRRSAEFEARKYFYSLFRT